MKQIIISGILSIFAIGVFAQKEVPFTLDDRDRLIRLETELETGLEATNKRIDDVNKRIDDMNVNFTNKFDEVNQRIDRLEDRFTSLFMWGFGVVFSGYLALFGFILYDRRTTIAPVKREQDKILKVLREVGLNDEEIRKAMKKVALW